MVEKVLKIFFTVCKSELLDIVYSSHRIEENASAGAENGHNGAILEKKVQNSSSATTKSERMLVKMDIRKYQGSKNIQKTSHNIEETASAYTENGHNGAIFEKKVQNSLPATTKSERMLVKMDIIELPCVKNPKPLQE